MFGYFQVAAVDFNETFAPVAKLIQFEVLKLEFEREFEMSDPGELHYC